MKNYVYVILTYDGHGDYGADLVATLDRDRLTELLWACNARSKLAVTSDEIETLTSALLMSDEELSALDGKYLTKKAWGGGFVLYVLKLLA